MKKSIILFLFLLFVESYSMIKPNGGETYTKNQQGNMIVISWGKDDFSKNIDILVWSSFLGEFLPIERNISHLSHSYEWEIPNYIEPGNYYRIKIQHTNDHSHYLMSSTFFSIIENDNNPGNNDNSYNRDIYEEFGIRIFPVPASNILNIVSEKSKLISVFLYDIKGNLCFSSTNYQYNFLIDLHEYSSSNYYLELVTENNKYITTAIPLIK